MSTRELGQFVHVDADEGISYSLNDAETAVCTIKLSPDTTNTTEFSLVEVEVAPQASVELGGYRWIDRILYGLSGDTHVSAGEHRVTLEHEGIAFVGRGNNISLHNASAERVRIGVASYPPAPDARSELLIRNGQKLKKRSFTEEEQSLLGLFNGRPTDGQCGPVTYLSPDAGPSFWQAAPSAGFVTVKLSTHNLPTNQFSASVQSLEPGAYVRQHGHSRTDELIVVTDGSGFARVEGKDYPLSCGSLVFLGRNILHGFHNTGSGPLNFIGFITPPGIENALSETGVARKPGERRPSGIVRNASTGKILVEKYGFILPEGGG